MKIREIKAKSILAKTGYLPDIIEFLKKNRPELINKYQEIWSGKSNYWDRKEERIKNFCRGNKVKCRIYFHHNEK